MARGGLSFVLVALIAACIPEAEPIPADAQRSAEIDALVKQWWDIVETPEEARAVTEGMAIAQALAERDALDALLEQFDAAELSAQRKVFLVQTVAGFVAPANSALLLRYTGASFDTTTRAAATTLLGFTTDDSVRDRLTELTGDSAPRVAFAARISLARLGDLDVRGQLAEDYIQGNLDGPEAYEVIRLVLEHRELGDIYLLTKAVADPHTEPDQRIVIAGALATEADKVVVQALRESKNVTDDPAYPGIADLAIASIKRHIKEKRRRNR
jgi:hypothetical protein